ncbi:MAG: nucleoside deaminase [Thiotrichales bacterium]|nr:nucleoside deaminase [Thiotrichales bacterium]
MPDSLLFMQRAIALSIEKMQQGCGGPFGAVIVKDGQVIAEGFNQVTSQNDPTAHAEISAIRQACQQLQTFDLHGCQLYTSCEPCPMCLSAICWARIDQVFYANTREDAARIGFDDAFFYQQVCAPIEQRTIPFTQIGRDQALNAFAQWQEKDDKVNY